VYRFDRYLSTTLRASLGSTVAVTDSTGALITQQRYLPFGGQRTLSGYQATALTDFGYTGQRALDENMGGIMDYRARFYSPSLGRFLQPDTLIPDAQNPQAWNRYSYVLGNPLRYSDPTGHKMCEDMDCKNDGDGEWKVGGTHRTPQSPSDDRKHYPRPSRGRAGDDTGYISDSILSEGTVYTRTWVTPASEAEGILLSSKAEESYTGNLTTANMPYWYDLTEAITGIASDFHNDLDWYPIDAEVNWNNRESGLWIDNIVVKNHSPSFVEINKVLFTTNLDYTDIPVPQKVVGTRGNAPGVINMDVNFQPSRILDTKMTIRFRSIPSVPQSPSIQIMIPVGIIPPAGCSIPR
jgi:RHS repeat-associated protein